MVTLLKEKGCVIIFLHIFILYNLFLRLDVYQMSDFGKVPYNLVSRSNKDLLNLLRPPYSILKRQW